MQKNCLICWITIFVFLLTVDGLGKGLLGLRNGWKRTNLLLSLTIFCDAYAYVANDDSSLRCLFELQYCIFSRKCCLYWKTSLLDRLPKWPWHLFFIWTFFNRVKSPHPTCSIGSRWLRSTCSGSRSFWYRRLRIRIVIRIHFVSVVLLL